MKIVLLSIWFSEDMGYAENCLPKALADLGHEVHVLTSSAQVYYNHPEYDSIYKPHLGSAIQPVGDKLVEGFHLHRLPTKIINNKLYVKKIGRKLKEIGPEVVQSFDPFSFLTIQGALNKYLLGYKYFTANHTHESVFPYSKKETHFIKKMAFWFSRTLPGLLLNISVSRCYPIALDALVIANKYYGVPVKKMKLTFLGVDTNHFTPANNEKNKEIVSEKRESFGIKQEEILCIYTGRFTEGKDPLLLAKAVDYLIEKKEPFRAIFLGNGSQSVEISKMKGCIVHNFVSYKQLPIYYQIADIGVWPKQESTSMLDAAASGLPIVISNTVKAIERIDGNGLSYIENDFKDLAEQLVKLKDPTFREKLSLNGIKKVRGNYSWQLIAKNRVEEYQSFINS